MPDGYCALRPPCQPSAFCTITVQPTESIVTNFVLWCVAVLFCTKQRSWRLHSPTKVHFLAASAVAASYNCAHTPFAHRINGSDKARSSRS